MLPPKLVKAELAARDDSDTRSFSTIVPECDWEGEHGVRAAFRDDTCVDLNHE